MKKIQGSLLVFLCLFLLASSGCVSAGKYKDLEDQQGQTQEKLTACEKERSELQRQLGMSSTEKSQLETSVADMRKALADAEARKVETEKRLAEFKELTSKFKGLVDAGKLSIKFQNGKMMLALSTDILFPSGSAQLSTPGKAAITEVAGLLKDLQNRNFQIEGHTDNVPIHSKQFPSNWELASARAMSVLNTMLAAGFPPEHVSTSSYGSYEPIADNSTKEGKSENRRIAIVIVPDLSGLPGFDEINRLSGGSSSAAASAPTPTPSAPKSSESKNKPEVNQDPAPVDTPSPFTTPAPNAPESSEKTSMKEDTASAQATDKSPETWPSPPSKSQKVDDSAPAQSGE